MVSAAKRNAMAVISDRGAALTGLPISTLVPVARCTETSGGLKRDQMYFRSTDMQSWINFRKRHFHNSYNDEDGGTLHDILLANPKIVSFGNEPFNHIDDFMTQATAPSTASIVEDDTYGRTIYLNSEWNTEIQEGIPVNLSAKGLPLSFSDRMVAYASLWMAFNANQVARVGFGMELSQNTVDIQKKVGMEMCSSTGLNWQAVTANGLVRTVSATSINAAPSPNVLKTYQMIFDPETAQFYLSSSDGISKVMTSTIPSGGIIENTRLFRIGINTTNPTPKHMWVFKVKFNAITGEATYSNLSG